jgi:hypothetical protein
VFQKEFYNDIPNVAVWRVLQKRSHLNATVQQLQSITFKFQYKQNILAYIWTKN